jgi:hypothetical protein
MEEIVYQAAYDPHIGNVLAVGPVGSLDHYDYVVQVETHIAEDIIEGNTPLHRCFIGLEDETLNFYVNKIVQTKIDDVIHRIPEWKWIDTKTPAVVLVYNTTKKTLKFGLSEEFGGQHKILDTDLDIKRKAVRWHGDTVMNFFATDYNDPHVCHMQWSFDIDSLRQNNIEYTDVFLSEKFSIFTRRILQDYVLVIE